MNKRAERKQAIDAVLDEEFKEFMSWLDQMAAEEADWMGYDERFYD